MPTVATDPSSPSAVHEKFSKGPGFAGRMIFVGVRVVGIAYIGCSLSRDKVVELLKKDGKTVDAHYYPNEGHGFEKRENQIDSIRRTLAWFDKYLKGEN
jgi:hypothetical protein